MYFQLWKMPYIKAKSHRCIQKDHDPMTSVRCGLKLCLNLKFFCFPNHDMSQNKKVLMKIVLLNFRFLKEYFHIFLTTITGTFRYFEMLLFYPHYLATNVYTS